MKKLTDLIPESNMARVATVIVVVSIAALVVWWATA